MTEGNKNGKVLLISYNQIEGFPEGRFEDDNVIVFSSRSGGQLLNGNWVGDGSVSRDDRKAVANARLLETMLGVVSTTDPSEISEAVVYVGQRAIPQALEIARMLAAYGKKLRIVGCDCNYAEKARVAQELGVAYELSECGGVRTMGRIAREYQCLEALAR